MSSSTEDINMIRRRRDEDIVPRGYWNLFGPSPLTILDEMDRLFDDFRSGFENYMITPRTAGAEALRAPAVDLIDEGDSYRIQAEVPGIGKDNVNIEVTEKDVEISAEIREEKKEEDKESGYIRRERRYSRFYRRVPLPSSVKADEVEAELKDGILSISLPKQSPPETKTKKVKVK
ncbi:MAG TPA: Hsp20/alpha crystallin family protein [Euryarchaeota archaeon]|nr:Hsp20/alpha crystallin family protein [Euryarchaeota archaeon]